MMVENGVQPETPGTYIGMVLLTEQYLKLILDFFIFHKE